MAFCVCLCSLSIDVSGAPPGTVGMHTLGREFCVLCPQLAPGTAAISALCQRFFLHVVQSSRWLPEKRAMAHFTDEALRLSGVELQSYSPMASVGRSWRAASSWNSEGSSAHELPLLGSCPAFLETPQLCPPWNWPLTLALCRWDGPLGLQAGAGALAPVL